MDAVVEYDYNAQNDDELTIRKGEKIKNATKKEEGWMEGDLNGKRGLFPDNFVKILKKSASQHEKRKNFFSDLSNKFINNSSSSSGNGADIKKSTIPNHVNQRNQSPTPVSTSPKPPAKPAKTHQTAADTFRARVVYSYMPVNDDELAIQENQIVEVIRLVEDGWFEGVLNGKKGVFPSNYVNKIEQPEANKSISSDDMEIDDKKNKKVLGVGLGNIFSGKPIELKTNKISPPASAMSPPQTSSSSSNSSISAATPVPVPTQPSHVPQPPPKEKILSKARVIYSYAPTQPDELQLQVGEIVNILDRNLEDEGWWKGELNGKVGVFPDNFVEEINMNINSRMGDDAKRAALNLTERQAKEEQSLVLPAKVNGETTAANGVAASNGTGSKLLNEHDIDNLNTDESMRIEEVQTDGKLIHMKKARQINKRPPSFRFKTKGEKVEDADSLLPLPAQANADTTLVTPPSAPLPHDGPLRAAPAPPHHQAESSPVAKNNETDDLDSSLQSKRITKTPSPPPYSSTLNHSITTHSLPNDETNGQLRQELDTLKRTTDQLTADYKQLSDDYKHLQAEQRTQKQYYDEQIQKLHKVLKDLVEEIDEEKKTRLGLQVELERVKKSVKPF